MTLAQYKSLIDYSSMNPKERLDFCRGGCHNPEITQRKRSLSKLFEYPYGEQSNEIQTKDLKEDALPIPGMQMEQA